MATSLLIAACGSSQGKPNAEGLDQELVDLVAPISGESIRNSRELSDEISRRSYEVNNECLDDKFGKQNWPDFQPDRTRWFDFPDVDELREYGFHPPGPIERDDHESGDPTPTGKAWDDAVEACQEQIAKSDPGRKAFELRNEWGSEVVAAARSRDEEVNLWKQAADCLVDLGYPRSAVGDEDAFLAWVTGEEIRLHKTMSESEVNKHQRKTAGDYVDCAEHVWKARTKFLSAKRDNWLASRVDQLRSLSEQIRSAP
ncbi:MAG: hypothetical protein WBA45_06710 [Microthrixaceae bacterium]